MSIINELSNSSTLDEKSIYDDSVVRKDTFTDKVIRLLVSNKRTDLFKMSDAWHLFIDLLELNPSGNSLLLNIEKSSGGYNIMMVLLDDNNEPVYSTTRTILGKEIVARNLDASVESQMKGRKSVLLLKPKLNNEVE